jgi:hypothetical protein
VLTAALSQVSVYDSDKSHDKAQETIQGKLNSSIDLGNNIKGQLQMLAQMYTELQHKNSAPETVRGPAAQPQPSSQPYSNSQLKDAALDLARRLREFQSEFTDSENRILMEQSHITDKAAKEKDFVDRNAKLLAFMNGTQARFVPLRAEAQNMRVQLLNRLPPQEANQTVDMVLNSGALAGPYPLYDVAAYFERLAGLLRP